MDYPCLETRVCKECKKEKYVMLDFRKKHNRNYCKECVGNKTKKKAAAKISDTTMHWKNREFKLRIFQNDPRDRCLDDFTSSKATIKKVENNVRI